MRTRPASTFQLAATSGSAPSRDAAARPAAALPAAAPTVGTATAPTRIRALAPQRLAQMLDRHALRGRRAARLLGMTTDWASTRWIPGRERGSVLPVFHVRVAGACPDRATGELLTRRLARQGWAGRLVHEHGTLRIDATRDDLELVLTAHEHVVTLVVRGAVAPIPASQARLLLAGVYEDDAAA